MFFNDSRKKEVLHSIVKFFDYFFGKNYYLEFSIHFTKIRVLI